MFITSLGEPDPDLVVPCRMAASGGGVDELVLGLQQGTADLPPGGLEGLLIASDLQGIAGEGAGRLLGEELADSYLMWAAAGRVPAADRVGVILAGDLFSAPRANQRGANGDVRSVWLAFARRFRWVAGVAGNHDTFGDWGDEAGFRRTKDLHLLDGTQVERDGLRIGGVGGIIGKPGKLNRKPEAGFRHAVRSAGPGADILILHEPPVGEEPGQIGRIEIREEVATARPRLTVCGHARWPDPLALRPDGGQILNVDGRAVLLRRAA